MFEMFRGGGPDPLTLWAVDQEERIEGLNRVVKFIKMNCTYGAIDIDDVAAKCGVYNITPAEADYVERKINER